MPDRICPWIDFIFMDSIVIIIFSNVKISNAELSVGASFITQTCLLTVYYWPDGFGYNYVFITVNVIHIVHKLNIAYKINFLRWLLLYSSSYRFIIMQLD